MRKLLALLLLCPGIGIAEPVNINTADADTLASALNGVGPKKAEAIIQYRKEHGEFKSLEDLKNVSGIGDKTVQINEKDILFADPGAQAAPVAVKANNKSAKPSPK
ncbi:MAG: helix-hairpin-helix domain-containing protein [Methylomonas sp.]|nr:helix-hairpin-helix domain-containing protein [Methylomonas sp.]PPD20241.1 MAG: competence protein ComEA [Methylomonas sp.]PPD40341.1 MAG: competence protein ComEA [Methylomonas sp.]PPD55419.1 MAG: competence protein ComEA [Methylomonas sp.]